MSRDLGIDQTTHDLKIEDGDLVIDSETNVVVSNLRQRLLTVLPEWFYNYTVGIDWIDDIFTTSTSYDQKVAIIKSEILKDPEILAISDFQFAIDPVARSGEITFNATTIYSPVRVEIFV